MRKMFKQKMGGQAVKEIRGAQIIKISENPFISSIVQTS